MQTYFVYTAVSKYNEETLTVIALEKDDPASYFTQEYKEHTYRGTIEIIGKAELYLPSLLEG